MTSLQVGAMVRYLVYWARFRTRRGTVRIYIGYTKCLEVRRVYHNGKPPAWLKCKGHESELEYKVLEEGIESIETALALEALHSARAIAAEPESVRGGPWAKPKKLTPKMLDEVRAAASVRSLMVLRELGNANPSGPLYRHLRDLTFVAATDAPQGAFVCRGAHVYRKRKPGRAGTRGNVCRRNRLEKGELVRGTKRYRRSKRGVDYKERRAVEERKRPSRPYASRAMKA